MGAYSSKKNSTLDYVQKVNETATEQSQAADASHRKQSGVNSRNLISDTSSTVSRNEKSDRKVDLTKSTRNDNVQRANRAMTISFVIPIQGVLPSAPIGTTNC